MFRIESFLHDVQRVKKPIEARSVSNVDVKVADVTVQLCPETLLKENPSSFGAYDDGVVCVVGRKNSAISFESDKTVSRQHCTIRLIVSPNSPLLASSSTSSNSVNKQWFSPKTKEEYDACAEGVDLVVTDLKSKYGTFIMKQQRTPETMDKTKVDNNNDTDTDTDNEAEAPMSLCFNANKAISDFTANEKSAEIEQFNLVQHMKLTPNISYPLRLSSINNDAIVWIQCGVSGSLIRITRASLANGTNAITPPNDNSNSLGNNDIVALSNEGNVSCTRGKEAVEIIPLTSYDSNEAKLEKEDHGTAVETQQTFSHRPTKRSKINNHESQWQSRITSDQKDRQIIRSDDSNPSYENSSTEKILSHTSAVTDHEISHLKARKRLPLPTKDGWLTIAPSKDRSAFRRIEVAQLIEEGGMEEALTECRTDLIVVHEKNKASNNQRRKNNEKSFQSGDFKKFHKNFVLKGLDDEENITLVAVLPKESYHQSHRERTQQHIEEEELFVDTLFNPKGPRNTSEAPNRRRAR
jgi:hypothetical protein